jgi:DNA-binding LytR/AlgR family response regulator
MSAHSFFFRQDGALKKLSLDEIIFIEAANNYVKFHKQGGHLMVRTTLDAALSRLPKNQFLRVHRSFAVSVDHIELIAKSVIVVKNFKDGIPVSRQHYPGLIQQIVILDGETPKAKTR